MSRIGKNSREAGYTLLEMLVTLVVISLLAVSIPALSQTFFPKWQVRSAGEQIRSDLAGLREEAKTSGKIAELAPGESVNSVRLLPSGKVRRFPDEIEIAFSPDPAGPTDAAEDYAVRFYPNGRTNGGVVTIGQGQVSYEIAVDWLSAAIEVKNGK